MAGLLSHGAQCTVHSAQGVYGQDSVYHCG